MKFKDILPSSGVWVSDTALFGRLFPGGNTLLAFSQADGARQYPGDVLVGKVVNIFLQVFLWIGILLLVIGVVRFLLSLKDSRADEKAEAVAVIVVGVALIVIRMLIKSLDLGINIDGIYSEEL